MVRLTGITIMFCIAFFSMGQVREPYVAGKFYPGDEKSLRNYLTQIFREIQVQPFSERIRAIMVPHAGYVYSGKVAAYAYAALKKQKPYRNVFIIGASHVSSFGGASAYLGDGFKTPLGTVPVNKQIVEQLRKNSVFGFNNSPHQEEHSLEVQLPFLQFVLDSFSIVPISIGTKNKDALTEIAQALMPYFTEENLFVISTDLAHYPSYNEAVKLDSLVIQAILSGDPEKFEKQVLENESGNIKNYYTAICGYSAVYVLLNLINKERFQIEKLFYANSGDVSKDYSRVVGYVSMVVLEKKSFAATDASIHFSREEEKLMFDIARKAIEERLFQRPFPDYSGRITPSLQEKCGVFVTLKIKGQLRGCIGTFRQDRMLWQNIKDMAVAAAFQDSRFRPLTKEEYPEVDIEISVLTPMRRISSIDEIVLGKHGIYIKRGFQGGTLLPQVAIEQNWTKEEFLGHCARDKAGIGWDGWKDKNTEIYVYEAIVIEENELK